MSGELRLFCPAPVPGRQSAPRWAGDSPCTGQPVTPAAGRAASSRASQKRWCEQILGATVPFHLTKRLHFCVEVTEHPFQGTVQGLVSPPLCLGGLSPDRLALAEPGTGTCCPQGGQGLRPGAIADGHEWAPCSLNGLLTG